MISLLWMLLLTCCTLPSVVLGQEAPNLTNYPKGSNQTHRTNVCDRFVQYAKGETNIRDALAGLNLTVGVVDHLNDFYIRFDETTGAIAKENPGIFVLILDELARRGQFNWRNNFARITPPEGSDPITGIPYNWTDVLYEAVVNYDFSFADWVHNQERRSLGISFPVGWYDASTILIQNQVQEVVTFDVIAFLKPFSNEVWAMIIGVFIVSGILYWLIDQIANWGTDNEVNSVLYDMFLTTMTFTQHHMYWDPSGHGKRIFAFSASFWSLVLASAYTANLASSLVSQGQPAEVATSLAEVEARGLSICVRANAAVAADLKLRYPRLNVRSGDGFEAIYKDLIAGECQLLATRSYDFDRFRNNNVTNPNCTLEWIGRQDNSNKAGLATLVDTKNYCTSLIAHVLDIHMNEMLDDYFIDLTWQGHIRSQSGNHQCGTGDSETQDVDQLSLTVKEVGGIFVFHAALGVVSIIVALVERWWSRRAERDMRLGSAVPKEGRRESALEKPAPRDSHVNHYQTSVALQSIIDDRAGLRKSKLMTTPPPSMDNNMDGAADFNEDVMSTIQSLQNEMEKLQNYVVEKRNRQNGEGRMGI